MQPVELAYAGIARQAELIAAGEVSSRELVELYLERISRYDPALNAFRVVFDERALLEAEQADSRRSAGGQRPLLGVPIAVKDDIDVAGEVTAWGTNAREAPAAADAEVVRRLREAGAVIIGKTNVPEMTLWPFTETATFGVTRNPWDLQRTPGGSSGGSGAAVAAGLVGAALGSDGAGSIRIPSAWCGLLGLKPQRGRVSLAPRPRAWHGMSVDGILTRRVADTALFHDVASGSTDLDVDRPDPPRGRRSSQAAATPPGRLRIAWSTKFPGVVLAKLDADARRALAETVELLSLARPRGPGARPRVRQRRDPAGDRALHARRARRRRRARAPRAPGTAHDGLRPPRRPRQRPDAGALASPARMRSRARLNGVLEDFDFLITPTVAAARAADRRAAGPRRAVDAQRRRRLGALQRRLEPDGAAGRRRPARASPPRACRCRCRSSRRRGARGRCWRWPRSSKPSGRGRTGGRPGSSERRARAARPRRRGGTAGGRPAARARRRRRRRARRREQEHADRSRQRGRPRRAARDPRAAAARGAPTTASWGRRAATRRARAGCAGSSTRSTARSTTCSGSRSGRSASPSPTPRARSRAPCTTRTATSCSRRLAAGRR